MPTSLFFVIPVFVIPVFVIPAKAGIHSAERRRLPDPRYPRSANTGHHAMEWWIPAFAGMTV